MQNNPRPWPTIVPHADSALRDSVARVTAHDPRSWGFVLARLRAAAGLSLAGQAAALGTTESVLTFLAVCRLPRPGSRNADLAAASALVGIEMEVLRHLLVAGAAIVTVASAGSNRR